MTVKVGISQTLSSGNSNSVGIKSDNLEVNFLLALSNAIGDEKITDLNNEINIKNDINLDIEAKFEENVESKIEVELKKILTENTEDNEIDEKLVELISGLLNNINPKINERIDTNLKNNEKIDTNLKNIDLDNNIQIKNYIVQSDVNNKQEIVDNLINYVENIADKINIENKIDTSSITDDFRKIKNFINNNEVKDKIVNLLTNNNLTKKEGYVSHDESKLVVSDDLEIMSNFRALSIKSDNVIDNPQNELSILNNIVMPKNNTITEIKSEVIQPQIIRSEYVSQDFIQTIKYLKVNNLEEISVKMNPKDLGELHIKILKSNNEEKVVVTSYNSDTFNLLKDNVNEIKNSLNTLDINVKEVDVEIKNGNQSDFSQDLSQQFNGNNRNKEQRKTSKFISENNNKDNSLVEDDDININLLI